MAANVRAKIMANTDPDGNPRKVFRRGCHPQCVTTILGGCGTHECPKATDVPEKGNQLSILVKSVC